ncbi:replication protein [Clostridioides difficile]|nr:replication protein [Clostridioides difficile]MCR1645729.1 replication protein [Clostridioides difficile]MDE3494051.1 replication protein [Clostridioides difficile]MDE3708421.1 replication protein [Clostridioides difficile]MDO0140703.1 replication protein [Clostridioides difficile]
MINLETLCNGETKEKIENGFMEIFKNIQDPNTPATSTRSLTVKVTFKPGKNRSHVNTQIQVIPKLASVLPSETDIIVEKDFRTGEVNANEYGNQLPGQVKLGDLESKETSVTEETEVKESEEDNIRKFKSLKDL